MSVNGTTKISMTEDDDKKVGSVHVADCFCLSVLKEARFQLGFRSAVVR